MHEHDRRQLSRGALRQAQFAGDGGRLAVLVAGQELRIRQRQGRDWMELRARRKLFDGGISRSRLSGHQRKQQARCCRTLPHGNPPFLAVSSFRDAR